MFRRIEFIRLYSELKRSLILRGKNTCLIEKIFSMFRLKRLLTVFPSISRETFLLKVKKLLKDLLLELPNVLLRNLPEERFQNSKILDLQETSGTFDNKDHKYLMTSLSTCFSKSNSVYGRGLFMMDGVLFEIKECLIRYLKDHVKEAGYELIDVPNLVSERMLINTGQLPKFKKDLMKVSDGMYLSPTGEVQLGNLSPDQPVKVATLTRCYRNERGYGRSHKGLIRNLEFSKLEIFSYTWPERSTLDFIEKIGTVTGAIKRLGLSYRVIDLDPVETGWASARTCDVEVWLPLSHRYLEISSISNCLDFQARRQGLRWRRSGGKTFPHTLNASCLPLGRLLVALIESYHDPEDPFYEGLKRILKNL